MAVGVVGVAPNANDVVVAGLGSTDFSAIAPNENPVLPPNNVLDASAGGADPNRGLDSAAAPKKGLGCSAGVLEAGAGAPKVKVGNGVGACDGGALDVLVRSAAAGAAPKKFRGLGASMAGVLLGRGAVPKIPKPVEGSSTGGFESTVGALASENVDSFFSSVGFAAGAKLKAPAAGAVETLGWPNVNNELLEEATLGAELANGGIENRLAEFDGA